MCGSQVLPPSLRLNRLRCYSVPVPVSLPVLLKRLVAFADHYPKFSALFLGVLSAMGFAPLSWWPLFFVALAALIAMTNRATTKWQALGIGWSFGLGHFALSLSWLADAFNYQAALPVWLGWIAVLLVAFYLAAYPGLAALGAWLIIHLIPPLSFASPPRNTATTIVPFAVAFSGMWIMAEWLRSWALTGFAWNPAGAILSATGAAPAIWLGTYGLGGLVCLMSASLVLLISCRFSESFAMAALPLLLGITAFFWLNRDDFSITFANEISVPRTIAITLVQPGIGQAEKWIDDEADINFAKLARMTLPKSPEPRLILWPEVAIPDYLEMEYPPIYYDRSPRQTRDRLTSLMGPDDLLLLGALKLEFDARTRQAVGARNAVFAVRADGTLGPRYDKAHLVPFGEYLPMRVLLSRIGLARFAPGSLDFWPGPGAQTLDLGKFGLIGVQICYEIIFSGHVVDRNNRPDFIFNPSNDAWFGTWGPPQHLAQARLRAIEEGLPVLRTTPTGITAVIAANGHIFESVPLHRAGRIDTILPSAHTPTLFARFGNILPLGFGTLLLLISIAIRYRWR